MRLNLRRNLLFLSILVFFSCHKSESFLQPTIVTFQKEGKLNHLSKSLVGAELNNFLSIEKKLDFHRDFQISFTEDKNYQFVKVNETENKYDFYLAVSDINSSPRIYLIRVTQSDLQDAKDNITSFLKSGKVKESFKISFFLLSGKHIITIEGGPDEIQKRSIYRKKGSQDSSRLGFSLDQSSSGCIDWYIVTTITYPDGTQFVSEEYIGTTCDSCMPDINNESVLPENCIDGSGSSGGTSDPPLEQLSDIVNDLTTPCFVNVFNMLRNNQQYANDRITQILIGNYTWGDIKNIRFKEKAEPGSADAWTTYSSSQFGQIANITMNSNLFPKASSEYVLATMIHEVLHAYLNVNKLTPDLAWLDHTTIADKYILPMTQCLQYYFPNLSRGDAEALAWGGLQGTIHWQIFQNDYPNLANQVLKINYDHKNLGGPGGTVGTWCK